MRRHVVHLDSESACWKNRAVPRRLIAAGLVVSVQVGALCAPLVHAHVDDRHTHHHDGRTIHAHLHGHHLPAAEQRDGLTPGVPRADESAVIRLQTFLAIDRLGFEMPALVSALFTVHRVQEPGERRPLQFVHSHDPPVAGLTGLRAPPA